MNYLREIMPGILRIMDAGQQEPDRADNATPRLSFDLRDLLNLIPTEGPRLAWSVFPTGAGTEMTGDFSPLDMTAEEFCLGIDESDLGVFLFWNELADLASTIDQTTWGTFIGCRDYAAFTGLISLYQDEWLYVHKAMPAYYDTVEIAFQAFGGYCWIVYVRDDSLLDRIANAFTNAKLLRNWLMAG